jgi:hypothetical protein
MYILLVDMYSFSKAGANVEATAKNAGVFQVVVSCYWVRIVLSIWRTNADGTLACQNIVWLNIFVHTLVAKIVVTLVHAPPEALMNAQVRDLACIAKNKAVVVLPICLTTMWIQRVAIRTLNTNVGIVELLLSF